MSEAAPPAESDDFSVLIRALKDTDARLEELTAGEVDAVADREGHAFLLQRAQAQFRDAEAAKQAAILDALPACVALLDARGIITSVNATWRRFGESQGLRCADAGIGLDYAGLCERAEGEGSEDARRVAVAIRAVLRGEIPHYEYEYACHLPTGERWFLITITPVQDAHTRGAVVMHLDVTARRRSEEALRRFATAMDVVADEIYLTDRSSMRFVHVNDAACRGHHLSREQLLAMGPDGLGLNTREQLTRIYDDIIASGVAPKPVETLRHRADGTANWLELRRHAQRIGRQWTIVTMVRDITERKEAEARIAYLNRVHAMLSGMHTLIVRVREREELYREACRIAVEEGGFRIALLGLLDPVTVGIVTAALDGKDAALLKVVREILQGSDGTPSTMVQRAISEKVAIVSNDSQSDPQVVFAETHAQFGVHSMVVLPLIVEERVIGVFALYADERQFFHDDEMMVLTELASNIAFATDHIDKQDRLRYLAYYDALTGLANGSLFFERVAQYLRSAALDDQSVAVVLMDLQRFKNLNDSLGRPAGDAMLRQVAQWITHHVGDANLVARMSGDQFAFVLPELSRQADLADVLQRISTALQNHPFCLEWAVLRLDAKMGAAAYPADGDSADALFRNAEAALKKAKMSGDRYLRYTAQMNESVVSALTLENQLRQALENQEFVLHYQPKVKLSSGQFCGAEALIRWNDPRTGLVPPARFIPILEQTGLIHEVGRWALQTAIGDYRRWRSMGLRDVRIAVNVSTLQLRARDFIAEIERVIGDGAEAAGGLELEITEGIIMEDVNHSILRLQAIRSLGVRVAVDDFGTGFSSLSYLSKLPIDTLKIDRSFVTGMTGSPQGLALVSTIIGLAHALKLGVVAEGVETQEQARLLRLLNCDEAQGYLFSKPLPPALFESTYLAAQDRSRS
jgi:diguanylate cyclase (GGDEF)-like protein/PAS domain S-box-containing protein